MFSENVLKIVAIHVYNFPFLIPRLHTEILVIVFDRAETCSSMLKRETQRDCRLKSLKEKQIILYSQNLKKTTFRVETITLCFFGAAYLSCSTRTIENGCVFEFQAKYLCVKLETSGLSRGT